MERIVAIVNSEIITLSDIAAFKKKVKSGGLVDDSLLKMTSAKKLEKDPGALVEHLINERLIDSEIKRQNLTVTIERVEKEIRSIAKKNKITRTQLMEALKSKGASVSEYQDVIKKTLE